MSDAIRNLSFLLIRTFRHIHFHRTITQQHARAFVEPTTNRTAQFSECVSNAAECKLISCDSQSSFSIPVKAETAREKLLDSPCESPCVTPSRSTSSYSPTAARSDPQPSFRKRFFDYIRTNDKFQRSTWRGEEKTEADFEKSPVFTPLLQQLSAYLALRSPENSSASTGTDGQVPEASVRLALEDRCAAAVEKLSIDEVFILADIWYKISEFDLRVPRFHRIFLERIAQETALLSFPHCLQTLLYSAAYRKISPELREKMKEVVLKNASNLDTPETKEAVPRSASNLDTLETTEAVLSSASNVDTLKTTEAVLSSASNVDTLEMREAVLSSASNLDTLETTEAVLRSASNVDTLEMDLVAFASYVLKIDFRKHPEFLSKMADVLLDATVDSSDMVNILKFLRQNDFFDEKFVKKFSEKLKNVCFETSSGVECCYILQAFASAKFYDAKLFQKLQTRIFLNLKEEKNNFFNLNRIELQQLHPSRRLRVKDLASYLYSLATINHPIEKADFVIEELKKRLKSQEFFHFPDFLIQSLYAFSLKNVYDAELLSFVFSPNTVRKLVVNDLKDAQRWLFCLYKNCQIEFPEGIPPTGGATGYPQTGGATGYPQTGGATGHPQTGGATGHPQTGGATQIGGATRHFQIGGVTEAKLASGLHREFFHTGYEMAHRDHAAVENVRKKLVKKYGREGVEFCRQIPHLEVCGFQVCLPSADRLLQQLKNPKSVKEDGKGGTKKIAVEVLDGWTSAVNEKRPLGVTVLKQRLLTRLGWTVQDSDSLD